MIKVPFFTNSLNIIDKVIVNKINFMLKQLSFWPVAFNNKRPSNGDGSNSSGCYTQP
jgi:hypothetical protein